MSAIQTLDKIAILKMAFSDLAADELAEMAALTELREYPADHILCREGEYEETFYVIAEGNAVISKQISEDEGERTLRVVGRGDLVGEMALIQNAPRSATVRTKTACAVLEMDKPHFETMLSRSPRMALNIIHITFDRMRGNDQVMIAELQRSNKVLRQLDRNKLEFIQVAAHELRTPITVLKGYANLLGSSPDVKANPALAPVADGILKGTDRMHAVVNTMLDVTRIDSDRLTLRASPILLKQLILEVVSGLTKAASERNIELLHILEADTPLIHGDPALIHKALYHLLVNAVKYTPDGGMVSISTRPVSMENGKPGALIAVRDTGIGLDEEHHDLVFEKFYQVGAVSVHSSGSTNFKGGGPGLGLAIVRGVARAHSGKTWVESKGLDEVNFPGCTFYLLLPV
ncbi:MAG: cyclic nucleotide-binding domain-containing protein [Anaerolineales bacterium]|uniref:cyclic nucleotide-binding domain-containing protein n=1 Tax=Candidatus Villigracilis vicinus TaxID=3140679 RepID=UPI0031366387|nr:cyclic nucleotide-binding domain-containing protein [Anaerolineales bacterium]